MQNLRARITFIVCLVLYLLPFAFLLGRLPNLDTLLWILTGDTSAYDAHIQDVSKRHGVDSCLVKAVIRAESQFDPEAISPRGAMGLMQLMPGTAKDMGIRNPFDPRQNIEGGVRYLKYLLKRFNNNLVMAVAAYNAGPETVRRCGGVPPFPETKEYLKKVMDFYSDYRGRT